MKINLTKRMLKFSELISFRRIADIGCDHGKITAKLFLENQIDYAIVSDISRPSAEKAKALLESLNIKNFDMRVGDGLETINEADGIESILISGMGGEEIIKILSRSTLKFKEYILGPQHGELLLKRYLIQNGYKIVLDKTIFDGKFYNIIKCVRGENFRTEKDLILSPDNFYDNEDFKKYLENRKNKLELILRHNKEIEMEKELNLVIDALAYLKGKNNE